MRSDRARRAAPVVLVWDRRAFRVLALLVAGLIVAGAVSLVLRFALDVSSRESFGFTRLFDLNEESNAPTWFSSVLLLTCAAMLALIAFARRAVGDRWVRYWFALSLIFVALSMDETATIHERVMRPLHDAFDLHPLFTNAWVLIAWPLLIVLLLLYLRFLLNLPKRTAFLFSLAGTIYVTGVTGVEVFSGLMKFQYGTGDLRFALVAFVEESLEMLGLLVFIYALADYAGREGIVWRLSAGTSGKSDEAGANATEPSAGEPRGIREAHHRPDDGQRR